MARGKHGPWITPEGLLRIESWASDGLTNKQISANMGISRETLHKYTQRFPDISDAIEKGRAPVVREVENALIKRAIGFEYEEQTINIDTHQDDSVKKRITRHKRYVPPDTGAAIFILKNYKPNKYRRYNDLTERKMLAEIAKMEKEIEQMQKEADNTLNLHIIDEWTGDENE